MRYYVTIDGVRFECRDIPEALQLFERAKETAHRLAEDQATWAVAAQEAVADVLPVPKLYAPKIEISSRQLRRAAGQTKRAIQAIYERELQHAELRMLMGLSQRAQDDDEALSLCL